MSRNLPRQIISWLAALGLWQITSAWTQKYALPGPSQIVRALIIAWPDLWPNLEATLANASVGLLLATVVGALLGVGFQKSVWFNKIAYGPALSLFALPSLALAPIFALTLPYGTTPIAMAMCTVFFPIAISMQRGLNDVNDDHRRLFRSSGAGRLQTLLYLEIPYSIPSFLAGIQVAITWSILGAMLGESVGARWGLGSLILGTLGGGDPARLWAIASVTTGISWASFVAVSLLRNAIEHRLGLAIDLRSSMAESIDAPSHTSFLTAIVSTLMAFLLFRYLSPLSAPLVLDPWETYTQVISRPELASKLLQASLQTFSLAAVALLLGLVVAICLAISVRCVPDIDQFLTSTILLTQAIPLTALAPVFVLSLGRGAMATIMIAILAIIFPAYIVIRHRLETVPDAAKALGRIYARSPLAFLTLVELPWSIYGVFTAIRIAAPRVLLGVMLAEYLATGRGLGFLLIEGKGRLEFETIWFVIYTTVVVGITLHFFCSALERRVAQ